MTMGGAIYTHLHTEIYTIIPCNMLPPSPFMAVLSLQVWITLFFFLFQLKHVLFSLCANALFLSFFFSFSFLHDPPPPSSSSSPLPLLFLFSLSLIKPSFTLHPHPHPHPHPHLHLTNSVTLSLFVIYSAFLQSAFPYLKHTESHSPSLSSALTPYPLLVPFTYQPDHFFSTNSTLLVSPSLTHKQ